MDVQGELCYTTVRCLRGDIARAEGKQRMLKKIWKIVAIAVLLALLLVFVPSPLNTYDAFAEIVTLPIDQTGGLAYDPAN